MTSFRSIEEIPTITFEVKSIESLNACMPWKYG